MELLERGALLDELRQASRGAAEGRGRVVVVEGESGVGKTSVLRAGTYRYRARVSLILAKLGVRRRSEAVAVARTSAAPDSQR